jgi:DNA polymerase-1
MLSNLLKAADSQHVVVVFDAGRATFRNNLYPEYKANRTEAPPDLVPQFPFFREIVRVLGIRALELPGYEADDVIGTLTDRLTRAGHEVVIVSGDKDLMQLVTDKVTIWDTMKDKHYRTPEVMEKFGVGPEQVVELLGLMGDASDNVPGLDGVGPKTAAQLVTSYGTVEAIIRSVEKIRSDSSLRNRAKIADQIVTSEATLRLSRKLVEIDRNSPVVLKLGATDRLLSELSDGELMDACLRCTPEPEPLHDLFRRFEFDSLIKELNLSPTAPPARGTAPVAYHSVLAEQFDAFLKVLKKQQRFAIDTETTSLNPLEAELVGVSFCWNDSEAFYVPLKHVDANSVPPEQTASQGELFATPSKPAPKPVPGQVDPKRFQEALAPILRDPTIGKIGQNLKYDLIVLERHGLPMQGVSCDTMIAAYLLNPDRNSFNLTALTNDYLKRDVIEYETVVGDAGTFAAVPLDKAAEYCGQDSLLTWLLCALLEPQLGDFGPDIAPHPTTLRDLYDQVEMPLVPVLAKMEQRGIGLDTNLLQAMSTQFAGEIATAQAELFKICGTEFNVNSPKQLGEVLFTKLGISTKGLKKTKTGISTDQSVLEKLRDVHPAPAKILEYRFLHKLKSTYIDALPAQVSPVTKRLHTKLNQTGTGTGRLSSSDPNLQNIPIQTAEGRRIRAAFIARPGCLLISADYSQIELRVLAHMSEDERMIAAFAANTDIHSVTAREVLGLPLDSPITPEQRRVGKTINFGIVYGMSGFRLAGDLGVSVSVGNLYIENYFRRYPGVRSFMDKLGAEAELHGAVTTLFGRKRILAAIDSSERDRGFLARVAMNAPIQGTAADIIKLAMVKIEERFEREKVRGSMILQIHDELLFEVEEDAVDAISAIVREEMEGVVSLRVPLRVELGSGKNWQESHG